MQGPMTSSLRTHGLTFRGRLVSMDKVSDQEVLDQLGLCMSQRQLFWLVSPFFAMWYKPAPEIASPNS
jgi:hypothetical protein